MEKIISDAVEVLRNGGTILYPTDTVWGLGCDATNPDAVSEIYRIKRRSDSKALVLLASDMDMVARYVREIPEIAVQLVEVNDRPMTIIYPGAIAAEAGAPADRHMLARNTVAEDGSVGIRIPHMEFCVKLVRRLGMQGPPQGPPHAHYRDGYTEQRARTRAPARHLDIRRLPAPRRHAGDYGMVGSMAHSQRTCGQHHVLPLGQTSESKKITSSSHGKRMET